MSLLLSKIFGMSEKTSQKFYLDNVLFEISEEISQKFLLRRRDISKNFSKTYFGMTILRFSHPKIKSFFSLDLVLDISKHFT